MMGYKVLIPEGTDIQTAIRLVSMVREEPAAVMVDGDGKRWLILDKR